jgi:hypothetical protein
MSVLRRTSDVLFETPEYAVLPELEYTRKMKIVRQYRRLKRAGDVMKKRVLDLRNSMKGQWMVHGVKPERNAELAGSRRYNNRAAHPRTINGRYG